MYAFLSIKNLHSIPFFPSLLPYPAEINILEGESVADVMKRTADFFNELIHNPAYDCVGLLPMQPYDFYLLCKLFHCGSFLDFF